MVKIAVIDNGIDTIIMNNQITQNLFIDLDGKCKKDVVKNPQFLHGTTVTKIIDESFKGCEINSIRILDDLGIGTVDKLELSLQWCLNNDIDIVNLSFGTTNFLDRKELLRLINNGSNQGLCIIAANSNNGFYTYPASFTNVVGVVCDSMVKSWVSNLEQLNIDIKVIAEKEKNIMLKEQPSNSFAAPYITAKVGKMYLNNKIKYISEVKYNLSKIDKYILFSCIHCNMPDWISNACIIDYAKNSSEAYYFQISEIEKADTIIIQSENELVKNEKWNKHIVYLGEEQVSNPNMNRFFWCKQNRIIQIEKSLECNKKIEIPIVIIEMCEGVDEMQMLAKLREAFTQDEYNAYMVSFLLCSVLYDMEYIPIEAVDIKSLYNFLCWELYLKKSDVMVIAATSKNILNVQSVFRNLDMKIKIKKKKSQSEALFYCDGLYRKTVNFHNFDWKAMKRIYQMIIEYLQEG